MNASTSSSEHPPRPQGCADLPQVLAFLEANPLAAITWDQNFQVTGWNLAATHLLGYPPDQVIGRFGDFLVPEGERDPGLSRYQQFLHQPQPQRCQTLHAQGQSLTCEWYNTPLTNDEGERVGMVSMVQDISDRQAAEQQLQTSQDFLHQLIDQLPDPIFVKNRQHQWILVNQAYCHLCQRDRAELLGKTDYEVYPADAADIFWAMDEHVFITRDEDLNEDYFLGPDQQSRYISTKKNCMETANGEQFLVGIIRDITDRKQTEDQIKSTQQFLNRTLDAVPDPIFVKNQAGQFVLVNRAGSELLGYPREEILGKTDYAFVPADQADIFVARDQKVIQSGLEDENEEYHTNSQGEERFISTKKICFTNPQGEPLVIAAIRDITDRKRMEEALQQSEQELRALFAAMNDVVLVLDGHGRYLKVAPTNPNLLYQPSVELVGKTLHEVWPQPEADRFVGLIQQTLAEQQPQQTEYQIEIQHQVLWFEGNFSPLGPNQVLLVARNISDRKQAEAQLTLTQDFLNNVLDGLADPIFVKDQQHRWVLLNRAMEQIMHHDRQALLGKSDYDFFLPEEADVFWKIDNLVLQTGQENTNEEYFTDANGEKHYISTKKTCFTSQGQKFLVGSIRDLTQRKQMEDSLRASELQSRSQAAALEDALGELQRAQSHLIQSEKMSSLGQLVAGVAHEINNPVNFIYANLSYAHDYAQDLLSLLLLYQQEHPEPRAKIREYAQQVDLDFMMQDLPKILGSMKMGAERIKEIVLSLRTFSRLDEAEFKAVDLHDGIESTLMILQSRLKTQLHRPAIELVKNYGELPLVKCYAGPLNQVLMNLLSNAIDALDEASHKARPNRLENPSITISTRAENGQIIIQVADNGPGIPPAVQPRIFDPFFTTKPVGQGTGMGLSISYQIITERHGGKLSYASAEPQGAVFTLTIPQR